MRRSVLVGFTAAVALVSVGCQPIPTVQADPSPAPVITLHPAPRPSATASTTSGPTLNPPIVTPSTTASSLAPASPRPSASSTVTIRDPQLVTAAKDHLPTLPVKGRAPKTGYSRDEFGPRWADVDRNGCDTRNDVLHRDLTGITTRPGAKDCVVLTGTLDDPYTGKTITFTKDQAWKVQIDHVYALSALWQHGAQRWDDQTRRRAANDPLNLLAVDGSTNASKGDRTPAAWMPPNRASWCDYSARYVEVAHRYGAWVSQADKDMLARGLDTCR
ncbi:HNH endonuclease family protein [Luteococcus sp.]|uniref:HNH endonuclease family protein n=1 Tax=Luteococcus sp. TaxID=1969402 RepID=UPI0037350E59